LVPVFVVFDPELVPAVFAVELLTVPCVFVVLALELLTSRLVDVPPPVVLPVLRVIS